MEKLNIVVQSINGWTRYLIVPVEQPVDGMVVATASSYAEAEQIIQWELPT